MVKQLCFDVNDCAEVRELLKQSNGNITDDKIDEIIACLASPQGIDMFLLFFRTRLSDSLTTYISRCSRVTLKEFGWCHFINIAFKKSGNAFFGSGKYLNEMDFTINGFSQKMYSMAVNNVGNEVKLQCSRYFTTGRVDEQNSKIDKVTFTFFGAATTADL